MNILRNGIDDDLYDEFRDEVRAAQLAEILKTCQNYRYCPSRLDCKVIVSQAETIRRLKHRIKYLEDHYD